MTKDMKYTQYFTEIIKDKQHFAFSDTVADAKKICDKLNNLDFRLILCKDEKLYSRRQLEIENSELRQENSELRITLTHIKKEFRERGILNEKEFLELIK